MSLSIETAYRLRGQPSAIAEVVDEAIEEFPEFTWASTPDEAANRIIDSVEELDCRLEITVRTANGFLVGILVATNDADDHVGPVFGVQWNYVRSDYRGPVGTQMIREALSAAKRSGFNIIAYTHRVGVGRYELTYRRLS